MRYARFLLGKKFIKYKYRNSGIIWEIDYSFQKINGVVKYTVRHNDKIQGGYWETVEMISEYDIIQNFELEEWVLLMDEKQLKWVNSFDDRYDISGKEANLLNVIKRRSVPFYTFSERKILNNLRKKSFWYGK